MRAWLCVCGGGGLTHAGTAWESVWCVCVLTDGGTVGSSKEMHAGHRPGQEVQYMQWVRKCSIFSEKGKCSPVCVVVVLGWRRGEGRREGQAAHGGREGQEN